MVKEILIYQPSKVGSTSVFTHLMNHYNLSRSQVITCPNDNDRYPINVSHRVYHTHHETTLPNGLKRTIEDLDKTVYYISMTRDPISRNISSFFEMPHYKTKIQSMGVDNLREFFINNYKHDIALRWYEHQMRDYIGFDLYSEKFNPELGYHLYENGNKKMLFIRAEDITEKINEGLGLLLDEKFETKLTNKNVTKKKNNKYTEFKNELKIPKEILDTLYNSKHIKHFYSDDEINQMRKKWE